VACAICGSDEQANIHLPEPERGCKRPDEHHEFVEEAEEAND
jgi:hypothetical protein